MYPWRRSCLFTVTLYRWENDRGRTQLRSSSTPAKIADMRRTVKFRISQSAICSTRQYPLAWHVRAAAENRQRWTPSSAAVTFLRVWRRLQMSWLTYLITSLLRIWRPVHRTCGPYISNKIVAARWWITCYGDWHLVTGTLCRCLGFSASVTWRRHYVTAVTPKLSTQLPQLCIWMPAGALPGSWH